LHSVHRLVAREQEGEGEEVQFLDLRRPVDCRSYGKVGDTLLQERELGRLPAREELAIKVVPDIDAPLRPTTGRPIAESSLASVNRTKPPEDTLT